MSQEGPEDVLVFYNLSKIVLAKARGAKSHLPKEY